MPEYSKEYTEMLIKRNQRLQSRLDQIVNINRKIRKSLVHYRTAIQILTHKNDNQATTLTRLNEILHNIKKQNVST